MRRLVCAAALLLAIACGGGSKNSTPTTPTTPTPTNRAPTINSMSFTPSFGIQQLTTFSYSVSASDPDGDTLTYSWDIAGNTATGTNGTISFSSGGNATARVTASDGKGGTATDSRTFIVGSMTGRWTGSFDVWNFTTNLTQNNTVLTGDYSDQLGDGRLDPASANTIDANGNVVLRYKQSTFSDFTFRGTMDSTGRRVTGGVFGSGYNGTPFTMNKQ